jgi:hypothetical protein
MRTMHNDTLPPQRRWTRRALGRGGPVHHVRPPVPFVRRRVGEVGLRKHHPRPATLATFGLRTASVLWGNLRCTGANKTLMPLMPCEFCCAGVIPHGGAYLRCRRFGWPCSGDEGPRGPGARRAGRGHRVQGQWRHGQGVRRGATPPGQDRYFGAEGAAILDTWLPPTCKVSSGRGRDKGGRV